MNNFQLISFNKDYIPTESFKLDLNNRAFRYGDGFFETMHANGLATQFIEDHYLRIIKASQILKLDLPEFFTLPFLKKQVSGLLSRKKLFQAARVKLSIYRTGDGFYIPQSNSCDIIIEATYLGKGPYELNTAGITVGIYKDMPKPESLYSSIKSVNAQFFVLAGIFARDNNFNDALVVNSQGAIIEATSSNIFGVIKNSIVTPSLNSGCIDGIMRKQIINIAEQLNFSIIYENIKTTDLPNYDELFVTNAIVGIKYISGYKEKRYFKRTATKLIHELNNIAFKTTPIN